MEAMTYVLDDRVWTREERDALPADGSRYELIDGALVVTPSPHWRHQDVVGELYVALRSACPADLLVYVAPMDVNLAVDSVLEPDLLVVRPEQRGRTHLEGAPLLAVEVLSPSTQVIDRNLKLRRYEAAGTPSYWLVDPGDDDTQPGIAAYELDAEGRYRLVAEVSGDETWAATRPFAVTIRPAALRR